MEHLEGKRVKVKPGAEVEELYRDQELVVKSVIHYTGADGREYVQCLVRGGLVCLNSAARFDKWNHAAVR